MSAVDDRARARGDRAATAPRIEPGVTVADVAKAVAVSTDAVRREIRRGALVAEKIFGRVRIRESELERSRVAQRIGTRTRPSAPKTRSASTQRRARGGSLAALRAIEHAVSG